MKTSYNKLDFIGQNIVATTDIFYCAFEFIIHSCYSLCYNSIFNRIDQMIGIAFIYEHTGPPSLYCAIVSLCYLTLVPLQVRIIREDKQENLQPSHKDNKTLFC